MIDRILGKLVDYEMHSNCATLIIDVHGIGYEIIAANNISVINTQVPHNEQNSNLNNSSQVLLLGNEYQLFIHNIIKEDANDLYGFFSKLDREIFCLLIKISGIGPKIALSILSIISIADIISIIQSENIARLTNIPGIGNKTAERIIFELKNKIKNFSHIFSMYANTHNQTKTPDALEEYTLTSNKHIINKKLNNNADCSINNQAVPNKNNNKIECKTKNINNNKINIYNDFTSAMLKLGYNGIDIEKIFQKLPNDITLEDAIKYAFSLINQQKNKNLF